MQGEGTMTDGEQVLDELVRLACEVSGAPIRPDKGLLDSGLSSVQLVSILERAASRWQLEIPVEVLFERGDLAGIADFILAAPPASSPSSDSPLSLQDSSPPSPSSSLTSPDPEPPPQDSTRSGSARVPAPPVTAGERRRLRHQIRQAVSEPYD